MEGLEFSFGGKITEADSRNYDLRKVNAIMLQMGSSSASSSNDYSKLPIDFQGKQPACGAHALARLKSVLHYRRTGEIKHYSPRYAWKQIKAIDGLDPEDGTDINSVFKASRTKGVCTFDLAGNDVTGTFQQYINLATTPAMDSDALSDRTSGEAFMYSPTWDEICQTIDLHGACVILLRVGMNMYRPSWAGKDVVPLSPSRYPMDSGHYMCAESHDSAFINEANSWGLTWGYEGMGSFKRDYMPYVVAIGTCVDSGVLSKLPFSKDLSFGVTDPDVKRLQIFLNANGFQVAASGVGSAGNETNYYGELTLKAVAEFQNANGIKPSVGIFGPITRAFINNLK